LKDERLQEECRCRHLRFQECTQDKTRKKEDTSLSQFTHQFGRGSLLKNQFYHFKDPSLPFIGRRTGHKLQRKLTREALQGSLLIFPILAPKMDSEEAPSRFFLKLTPIGAIQRRCL